MAAPTRFTKVGLSGRTGVSTNTLDSFIQTFEIPLAIVASTAAQDTGIAAPANGKLLGGFIKVDTAEVTTASPTITLGVDGATGTIGVGDVDAVGLKDLPNQDGYTGGTGNFTYTLSDTTFAEFAGSAVITVLAYD